MGAVALAIESAERVVQRAPADGAGWARIGRLHLRQMDADAALRPLERARELEPTVEGLLDLALTHHLRGDIGGEVTAAEQATLVDGEDPAAWARYAHALARTDRVSDAIGAAARAVELAEDSEVAELLERLREIEARRLPEQSAAA